ncbi:hypothetical protein [Legionella bononiensis]|uniref:Uncharacterized protein n=1 Tax=Legionella bononiensis TaxID=2793102 RepID=A0ABS1WFR6_9GAMM|nr:hypothetical protein [Legionella bononiensis]MBL7481660.1 hypothetical protein [Legionella bononiensis]MBL7528208.1 hypothetical protein [Legionella bononiensis]MBL7562683.1 hypothetical protein [Legionella bononiensis]
MRFFCTNQFVTYPDEADKLREQILEEAIKGPQKRPMAYFEHYFSNKGQVEHPLLGNLYDFAAIIETLFGTDKGHNLVSGMLRFNLDQIEPEPDTHTASSSTADKAFR